MIICLIILLFVAEIAIQITIGGLDVALFVAKRADDARMVVSSAITHQTKRIGKKTHLAANTVNSLVNTATLTLRTAATVVKPVVQLGLRGVLLFFKIVCSLLRKLLTALSTTVLVIDIVIALIVIAAGAWFIVDYTNTDEEGEVVISEEAYPNSNGTILDISYSYSEEDVLSIVELYKGYSDNLGDVALDISLMCNIYEQSLGTYASLSECVEVNSNFVNIPSTSEVLIESERLSVLVRSILIENKRALPVYVTEVVSVSNIESASNNEIQVGSEGYHRNVTECKISDGNTFIFYRFSEDLERMYCYMGKISQEEINKGCYGLETLLSEIN